MAILPQSAFISLLLFIITQNKYHNEIAINLLHYLTSNKQIIKQK